MSLDVMLRGPKQSGSCEHCGGTGKQDATEYLFDANITHNLNKMAAKAGLYDALWRPERLAITTAGELIPVLEAGLKKLQDEPDYYRTFNPENGWGKYENLLEFTWNYLKACKENPSAEIVVSR